MKLTGPKVISQLREKLQFDVGRHLYGVLGTYRQLERFERVDLAQARDHEGRAFPPLINLNRQLLERIGDNDLNELVGNEARRPESVRNRLSQELRNLISEHLTSNSILAVKNIEVLFTYSLDLSVFRISATNRNHILLLLPGARLGQTIILFHEAQGYHRTFPANLIADNHLWELTDD